jgi:hypothetical protein
LGEETSKKKKLEGGRKKDREEFLSGGWCGAKLILIPCKGMEQSEVESLGNASVEQLKALLRKYGLKVSGNKAELLERLEPLVSIASMDVGMWRTKKQGLIFSVQR